MGVKMGNYELAYFKEATDKIITLIVSGKLRDNAKETTEEIATIIHDAYEEGINENPPDEDYEPPEPQHNEGYD
jgi:hypothetical protein